VPVLTGAHERLIASLLQCGALLPTLRSCVPSFRDSCRARFEGLRFEEAERFPAVSTHRAKPSWTDALAASGCVQMVGKARNERRPLTIVVNDTHRATATRPFLDALFAMLDADGGAGPAPRVRLLVAAGSHRSDADERRAHEADVCGPWRVRFEAIAWHDADDSSMLESVGSYRFHRWMTEGGCYLACGSLEPHYFAGVTGAHKTLTVGVMAREGIQANHSFAMRPEAAPLRLRGNPVHEGIVAALRALEGTGASLAVVNEVLVGGRIAALTAGHPLAALEEGLPHVRAAFTRRLRRPVDLLLASIDPPLDRDVYQADKGIKNTEVAVRDGGVLIVAAECHKGIGIDHFVELLREADTHARALAVVDARGYRLGDHKAVRLRALTDVRGVRIVLVSPHLDPALGRVLGMQVVTDLASAARWARPLLADDATAAVIEDAGNVALEIG